jgi:tetraacyldisaccharide 4'-kinase
MKAALAKVYGWVSSTKNFLYDQGIVDSLHLQTPVVSIGNLTVGGTGKTPVTQMIIDYYLKKMIRPAIVGRNYKALLRGIGKVDISRSFAAQYFGDEPTLLAMKNPETSVFVGPVKWKVSTHAEQTVQPDVIVIDDGFQHRALYRNLDIVLIDATAPLADYQLLPQGRAREHLRSLQRAHWIFLTKVNLAGELRLAELKKLLPPHLKILEVAYRLQGKTEEAGFKALAFAGLARPESFRTSLKQDTLYDVVEFIDFPDHYAYTAKDVERILQRGKDLGVQVYLTTEKDWTKIQNLVGDHAQFRALELKTQFLSGAEEFHADLDKVVH